MRTLFTTKSLDIPVGQAVSGIAKEAQTLRVVSGRVWITIEGISQDYWLSTGDKLVVPSGQLTVIEAESANSEVEMVHARDRDMLPQLGAQLRLFTQRIAASPSRAKAKPVSSCAPC